jgi:hypothetical protein
MNKDIFTRLESLPFKLAWTGVFITVSIWFFYWIFYDVSVWGKSLYQVNSLNYVGVAISITLVIAGTQVSRFSNLLRTKEAQIISEDLRVNTPQTKMQATEQISEITEEKTPEIAKQTAQEITTETEEQIKEPIQTEPILKETKPKTKSKSKSQPQQKTAEVAEVAGCSHSFGYLRRREKTEKIPSECLTCPKVINCISTEN